jgi:hypothetical protein
MTPAPQSPAWLKEVMRSSSRIDVAIPDDLGPQEIASRIRQTSELAVRVETSRDKTHAVLGRLLMLARRNPQSYEALGYENFTDYLNEEVAIKYGVGRTTAMNCKRIAEKYGSLGIETYAAVSEQKLLFLAKFSSGSDSNAPKLLKAASEKTFEQLRTWSEEKGYLGIDEAVGATLTITGSLNKVKQLRRFLAREDVRAHVESDDPLEILLAAIAEVDCDWTIAGAAALKELGAAK